MTTFKALEEGVRQKEKETKKEMILCCMFKRPFQRNATKERKKEERERKSLPCERFDFEVEAVRMIEKGEKLKPLDLTHQYARWFPSRPLSIETSCFC